MDVSLFLLLWCGERLDPNLFGDFLHQGDFCPLFFFGELVANFAAGKAALRGKAQMIKGNVL